MDKSEFITLMENREWRHEGYPDISNSVSDDPNFDFEAYGKQIQFIRGRCIIFTTDKEIESMTEVDFFKWFEKKSDSYYFEGDWLKAFKGSEFLIPVVEKERKNVKSFALQDGLILLCRVQEGEISPEDGVKEMREMLDILHKNKDN